MYSAFQSAAGGWEVPSRYLRRYLRMKVYIPSYLRTKRYSRACVTDFFLLAPGQEWSSLS